MAPTLPRLLLALLLAAGAAHAFTHNHIGHMHSPRASQPVFKHLGRWCCLNEAEFAKCEEWRLAANHTATEADTPLASVQLECVRATDKFDCYKRIFSDQADLMSADAGEVYTAGKFYNLMPLANEVYASPTGETYETQYTVAVVRRGARELESGVVPRYRTMRSGLAGRSHSFTLWQAAIDNLGRRDK